jgi:DNA-binding transcriptional LysR family regulator
MDEQNSRDVVLAVLDGRADIGIFAERTPSLGLQTTGYRRDRLVLVVPKGHALAGRKRIGFADATEFDFVALTQGTSLAQRLALETQSLGKALRVRIHVRSFDAMCQMVAAGLGIAVLPDAAVQPHLRSMGLRRIELTDAWVDRGADQLRSHRRAGAPGARAARPSGRHRADGRQWDRVGSQMRLQPLIIPLQPRASYDSPPGHRLEPPPPRSIV